MAGGCHARPPDKFDSDDTCLQTDKTIEISADIPGVSKEDINVRAPPRPKGAHCRHHGLGSTDICTNPVVLMMMFSTLMWTMVTAACTPSSHACVPNVCSTQSRPFALQQIQTCWPVASVFTFAFVKQILYLFRIVSEIPLHHHYDTDLRFVAHRSMLHPFI